VLFALARSIEGKDPYTQGHCERLAEYSARLGEHMGLPAEEIKALRRAGIVHDIGKVAVPDSILLKPSRLNRSEQMILRLHQSYDALRQQIGRSVNCFRGSHPKPQYLRQRLVAKQKARVKDA
jgi:HD-GYP domain-containing protein (c-di-GMP phosphodiesterase class II)